MKSAEFRTQESEFRRLDIHNFTLIPNDYLRYDF